MSKKRIEMKTDKRRRQSHQKVVQIITISIVVLAVAAILWIVISSQQPKTNAGNVAPTIAAANNGKTAPTVAVMQFAEPPPMQIDVNKQYFVTVKMLKVGEFVIQLYPDKAPITVNSFIFLARQGFFNGVTFHRVIDGFMAQGGDQSGTGMSGPGYEFVNEKNDLLFDKAGVVAMANAGPDTNGSQFFITFGPVGLDENDYTIFGQVISGMDVVNGLTPRDPQQNPSFSGDVMESVTISEK
jgi:cyclophilin family peptidyl-prolyl cis-trans isomerase